MRHNLQSVLSTLTAHHSSKFKRDKMKSSIETIVKKHFFTERNICSCCGRRCPVSQCDLGPKCKSGKCSC